MEFQKIANLLDAASDDKNLTRFVTKKWVEIYDQSGRNYNVNKEIRIKTSMLRSVLIYSYVIILMHILLRKEILLLLKIYLLLLILRDRIIQILMQLILIMKTTMRLVKKNCFLKIMHHLSIVFKRSIK